MVVSERDDDLYGEENMTDYRQLWKVTQGYFDPDTLHLMSDADCDQAEDLLRKRRELERMWTPYYFRTLFRIVTARSGQAVRVDKETVREGVDVLHLLASLGIEHRVVGGNAVFRCPFHKDGRPSASFSLKKKMWYCYPEGRGGDVFSFYQEITGCSFREAVEKLST